MTYSSIVTAMLTVLSLTLLLCVGIQFSECQFGDFAAAGQAAGDAAQAAGENAATNDHAAAGDTAQKAVDSAIDAAKAAGDSAAQQGQDAGSKAAQDGQALGDSGRDAAKIGDDAANVGQDAAKAGQDAGKIAQDAAKDHQEASDLYKDAEDKVSEVTDDLAKAEERGDADAIKKYEDLLKEAEAAKEKAEATKNKAEAAKDKAESDANDANVYEGVDMVKKPSDSSPVKPQSSNPNDCFDGQSTVVTTTGVKRLDELQVGDMVSTRNGFSKVVHWIHRSPIEQTSYLKIHLVDGNILTISSLHLLYMGKCSEPIPDDPKFAHRAQRSQCLFTGAEATPSEIVDIKEESSMGLFAPLTENGDIMVNGVHASCYCNVENGKTFLRLIHQFVQLLDSLIEPLKSFGVEFDSFKFVAAGADFIS